MADNTSNAKTTLVELCQRYLGKSMGKADIVYKVNEFEGQFQATVKLDCIDGQEFAGELCANSKDAEKAAAHQALEGLKTDIAASAGVKRKAADISELLKAEAPSPYVKAKLREAVKQLVGRDLVDADMVFEVNPGTGGNICSLKIPCLSGALGARTYLGAPSPFKRDTMLNACSKAMDAITADPEASAKIDMSKVQKEEKKEKKKSTGTKKEKDNGGAKGKGKGDMMSMMMMMMMMKGKGKGKQEFMGEMMKMMGSGGKNAQQKKAKKEKKPGGPDLPRERVSTSPITGVVEIWRGKFGWVKPEEKVEHEKANKNKGQIYVHSKDVAGEAKIEKGMTLQFQVYVDSSGLGAEEVVVL